MIRFLLSVFLLLLPAVTMAQEFQGRARTDFTTGPSYKTRVHEALTMHPDFNFGYFRGLYSNLDIYEPFGDDLQREILTLAYTIKNDPPTEKRLSATERYTEILLQHLANMDVVAVALSLARENPEKFGNPQMLEWLYRGLLENVMGSGDGTRLTRAYKVITLGEETAILGRLKLKVLETTPAHEGAVYYNMHRVQDPKTGQIYTVFVDTTLPMTYLAAKAQEQDRRLNLRR